MPELRSFWKTLLYQDGGVSSIEYALLGSLIAMATVGAVVTLGDAVQSLYQMIADSMPRGL
ncbi:Flp family type IVb pilin [Cupriavidus sp. AcVe19-1a]|uniref:Flp family type IVb pilin n=1 Tax=Cupriavidus sp. AcVe19-1a TaxID=2821359 RepID=UPI001AE8ECE7|nr:Flp family type IVb pilin [Cupriavidus sp. AcVe19-1a]MBP0629513.1 Flp family type IVb pilin [Cupriavidus sp. AcVe19-1a]